MPTFKCSTIFNIFYVSHPEVWRKIMKVVAFALNASGLQIRSDVYVGMCVIGAPGERQ